MSTDRRPDGGETEDPTPADGPGDGRNWGEWVLVAVVVLSFVVIPGLVLLNPPGLPFRVAFLLLPLLPAVLLGATAVWVALKRGSGE